MAIDPGTAAIVGGGLGAIAGFQPSGSPTSTTTTTPNIQPDLMAALLQILQQAPDLFQRLFNFNDPAISGGQEQQLGFLNDPEMQALFQDFTRNALRGAGEVASLDALDPSKNPALAMQQEFLRSQVQDFFDINRVGLQGDLNTVGNFGSTRGALLEGNLLEGAAQQIAGGNAAILGNERNLITQAGQLFQNAFASGLAPGAAREGIGGRRNERDFSSFMFPQQQLMSFADLIRGFMPGTTGQTTTTRSSSNINPWLSAFRGGLGGAAAGAGGAYLFGGAAPAATSAAAPVANPSYWSVI